MKCRRILVDNSAVNIILSNATGIEERYDMEFEQFGCDKDHMHLLCTANPKIAPNQIVRVFKGITARELFNPFSSDFSQEPLAPSIRKKPCLYPGTNLFSYGNKFYLVGPEYLLKPLIMINNINIMSDHFDHKW